MTNNHKIYKYCALQYIMKMRDYLLIPVALVGVYLMHKSDNNDESFLKGITPHKDYSVTVNLDSVDVKKTMILHVTR